MDGEIVDPDDEGRDVDGEDPEHEDEDGVGVVVEVEICDEMLLLSVFRS